MQAWKAHEDKTLKNLWPVSSASEISLMLGRSRNSIIGRMHRLGLSKRVTYLNMQETRSNKVAGRKKTFTFPDRKKPPKQKRAPVVIVEELVIPIGERASIQTLTATTCRWPIGDPGDEAFHFCGRDCLATNPYCDHHAARSRSK